MRRVLGALLALCLGALTFVGAGSAQAATHTPVVFVHGYAGSASNWTTAEALFTAAGYSSNELYAYQYNWAQSNRTSAAGLASYVDQVRQRTGSAKVDIVNHSMGGLVTDWYVKQLGGAASVSHVASLAGANHGTTSAGACLVNPSCQEMYPGSSFIAQVTSGDETPGPTRFATWYSPCDGVIIPYTSTTLSGATNNYVACETHIGYLTDAVVLSQVRSFLGS
ncbi:alpha/beta fold hydrolase [Amycolatopsis acidiphila]|uniref:Alpha/beta fold hydrolase n=1 Tax=Amycolatopsis acidiphila TaxID=715473 RepID=A0A558A9E9_9PSEU|nr:alpha/beta fold hydrolase [Amycolatopsis acidiphila]TVT20888.1 alpha/beta fold hydrolase [Amycolatopsis acidiphila]UIJ63017.1 alpha/beta fold hydrolase [Amycolatopsis acidiphila]GHG65668.1 lipase [Amycolatopsis acidiphila]